MKETTACSYTVAIATDLGHIKFLKVQPQIIF